VVENVRQISSYLRQILLNRDIVFIAFAALNLGEHSAFTDLLTPGPIASRYDGKRCNISCRQRAEALARGRFRVERGILGCRGLRRNRFCATPVRRGAAGGRNAALGQFFKITAQITIHLRHFSAG
jgi:hypothetical protein